MSNIKGKVKANKETDQNFDPTQETFWLYSKADLWDIMTGELIIPAKLQRLTDLAHTTFCFNPGCSYITETSSPDTWTLLAHQTWLRKTINLIVKHHIQSEEEFERLLHLFLNFWNSAYKIKRHPKMPQIIAEMLDNSEEFAKTIFQSVGTLSESSSLEDSA